MTFHGYVEIIEQPAPLNRFRYDSENRDGGRVVGASSTPEHRTYFTIKIHQYVGPATIYASCVTKDYFVHPHNLVGNHCNHGVYCVNLNITDEFRVYPFRSFGIRCMQQRNTLDELRKRQMMMVDPFRRGFLHDKSAIDFNAVRIAIQVVVKNKTGEGVYNLAPVCTDIISKKKVLNIIEASPCSGLATGGTKMIILCDQMINSREVEVVFYELDRETQREVWCERAEITRIHKSVCLSIMTPTYRYPNTSYHVNVLYQLRRRSTVDPERSESRPFEYIPNVQDKFDNNWRWNGSNLPGPSSRLTPIQQKEQQQGERMQPDPSQPGPSQPGPCRPIVTPVHVQPEYQTYNPHPLDEQGEGMQAGPSQPGPSRPVPSRPGSYRSFPSTPDSLQPERQIDNPDIYTLDEQGEGMQAGPSQPGPSRPGPSRPSPSRPGPSWPGSYRSFPSTPDSLQPERQIDSPYDFYNLDEQGEGMQAGPSQPSPSRPGPSWPGSYRSFPSTPDSLQPERQIDSPYDFYNLDEVDVSGVERVLTSDEILILKDLNELLGQTTSRVEITEPFTSDTDDVFERFAD